MGARAIVSIGVLGRDERDRIAKGLVEGTKGETWGETERTPKRRARSCVKTIHAIPAARRITTTAMTMPPAVFTILPSLPTVARIDAHATKKVS